MFERSRKNQKVRVPEYTFSLLPLSLVRFGFCTNLVGFRFSSLNKVAEWTLEPYFFTFNPVPYTLKSKPYTSYTLDRKLYILLGLGFRVLDLGFRVK